MDKRERSPLLLGMIFRIILIIAASALVISYISVYIDPTFTSIPLLFGLYFIPIVAINIILLIIAISRRSKSAWLPFLTLLPSLIYADMFIKLGNSEIPEITKDQITLDIASYNVGMFSSSKEKLSKESCQEEIFNLINTENPSIVCIQEFYTKDSSKIHTLLPKYPYKYYHLFKLRNGALFGNITASKYPIREGGKISFNKSTNLSIYTDITINAKVIRIFNNHLESYNLSFTNVVKNLSEDYNQDEILAGIVGVHDRVIETFVRRSKQVNTIMDNIKQSELPTIICGDFNDTPMSYTYHKLSTGKKDSFKEAGDGFSATYRMLHPLLRIDYILFPSEYRAISHETIEVTFSDHYPIIAKIII